MGSFKCYVTPEAGEGKKICYKPLRKLGGGKGISVMSLRNAEKSYLYGHFHQKLTYRKLFFVLFNLKNPGIQVKIILATG